MNRDTVKKGCPFYNDSESCKKLQSKRNCYQCPFANFSILKSEYEKLKADLIEAEKEIRQFRFFLDEKVSRKYLRDTENIKE